MNYLLFGTSRFFGRNVENEWMTIAHSGLHEWMKERISCCSSIKEGRQRQQTNVANEQDGCEVTLLESEVSSEDEDSRGQQGGGLETRAKVTSGRCCQSQFPLSFPSDSSNLANQHPPFSQRGCRLF